MGKSDRSKPSIERRNWGKIFNGLTQMLRTQQNQLETLVTERKLLEDRVKMQHERWVADIRLYEDHVSQVPFYISSFLWNSSSKNWNFHSSSEN